MPLTFSFRAGQFQLLIVFPLFYRVIQQGQNKQDKKEGADNAADAR